jgi:hypothetical protein
LRLDDGGGAVKVGGAGEGGWKSVESDAGDGPGVAVANGLPTQYFASVAGAVPTALSDEGYGYTVTVFPEGHQMIEYVYRFRPLTRLLDQGELLNQEIYFAPPEQLNDPMEGFRDVIWQGDKVLWSNLFRHYLRCLQHACILLMISGEDYPLTWDMIPLFRDNPNTTPQHREETLKLINRFLELKEVTELVNALASRSIPVRRAELAAVLRHAHLVAIMIFNEKYKAPNKETDPLSGLAETKPFKDLLAGIASMAQSVSLAETVTPNRDNIVPAIFDAVGHTGEQLQFIYDYNDNEEVRPNRRFVLIEFPQEYVKRLEDLVYPKWYAACFMSECNNPSVWGTYGDGHNAICLKFKVHSVDGVPAFRLRRKKGYSNSGDIVSLVKDRLRSIAYENTPPSIDFFRMIGRIPKTVIKNEWYTDPYGKLSTFQHGSQLDEKAWQEAYWDDFIASITRKLVHWKHENEYRLILDNTFWNLAPPKDRIASYDFSDLDGIVFGIRTPLREKKKICKIIEDKCASIGRGDFKFYQAYYSPTTGQVEHAEMSLLKFTPTSKKSM